MVKKNIAVPTPQAVMLTTPNGNSTASSRTASGQPQQRQRQHQQQKPGLSVLKEVELESDSLHQTQHTCSSTNSNAAVDDYRERLSSLTANLIKSSMHVEEATATTTATTAAAAAAANTTAAKTIIDDDSSLNSALTFQQQEQEQQQQQQVIGTTTPSGSSCYSRRSSRCSTISSGLWSLATSLSPPRLVLGDEFNDSTCHESDSSLDPHQATSPRKKRGSMVSFGSSSIGGMPSLASICADSQAANDDITINRWFSLEDTASSVAPSALADSFTSLLSHDSFGLPLPHEEYDYGLTATTTTATCNSPTNKQPRNKSNGKNNRRNWLILLDANMSHFNTTTPAAETLDCLNPTVEDHNSNRRNLQFRWEAEAPTTSPTVQQKEPAKIEDGNSTNTEPLSPYSEQGEYWSPLKVPVEGKATRKIEKNNSLLSTSTHRLVLESDGVDVEDHVKTHPPPPPPLSLERQRSRDRLPSAPTRRRSSSQESITRVIKLLET